VSPHVEWFGRLGLLLVVLAAFAAVDVLRNGKRATRPREYAFLLIVAVAFGILGIAVDQIDVRISPEFFTIGKGLDPDRLDVEVVALGFRAGFTAGTVIAGVALIANGSRPGSLPLASLARRLLAPVAAALVLAPVGAAIAHAFDPFGTRAEFSHFNMSRGAAERAALVQGIHLGLYAGMLAGLIGVVASLVMRRQRTSVG
jgi:hypothetical protein